MLSEKYLQIQLPDPSMFKNTFVGKSAIIIGTGMSTKKLIKYKDSLVDKFDAIIGLNFSTNDFENQLTHHLLLEKKPVMSYTDMIKNNDKYRKELPRILNWKGLHRFPKNLNIVKATRTNFGGEPNIREYKYKGYEGFLNGPLNEQGLSTGSVALHGIHLACFMGCNRIYLVGTDFVFGEKFDHYYEDRYYRDNRKEIHKSPIINIGDKKKSETTQFFQDSAKFIDKAIITMCNPIGIDVFSFSDGLLTAPVKLDIDEFFEGEK